MVDAHALHAIQQNAICLQPKDALKSAPSLHDEKAFLKFLGEAGLVASVDGGDAFDAWLNADPAAAPAPATAPAAAQRAGAEAGPATWAAAPAAVSAAAAANELLAAAAAAPWPAAGAKRARPAESADTLPMPRRRCAAGGAAGPGDDDSDTLSSSPNDLAGAGPTTNRRAAASGGGAAARGALNNRAAAAAAAAAEAERVFKAVLVAKVLTKSDASSKRIILPRIAVEANLPHLTSGGGGFGQGRSLAFAALDRSGREWPLCIKAWANGANPKPVFVLEGGVGELMKTHRLGAGDVVGVLASEDGRHFVHWNTDQVRDAAARPTLCSFEFEAHRARAAEAAAAEAAAAAAAGPAAAEPAAAPEAPPAAAAPAPAAPQQPAAPAEPAAPAAGSAPPTPLMTAVPLHAALQVPGMYLPGPACEVLVMSHAPYDAEPSTRAPAYLAGDGDCDAADAPLGAAAAAALALAARPLAAEAFGDSFAAAGAAFGALSPAASVAAPAAAAAAAATVRVGSILHQGGALLCPRTHGCQRPAGHQGWCLGHGSKRNK